MNSGYDNPTNAKAVAPSQEEIAELYSCFGSGDMHAAERRARSLARDYPGHPIGWKALGAIAYNAGRFDESLSATLQASALEPSNHEIHANLGGIFFKLRRLGEAEASYREAIRLDPNQVASRTGLADALRDLKRFDEAESCYREAIRLAPANALAHASLGGILLSFGRLREAERSYRDAIRLKADYAPFWINLGTAQSALGLLGEAEGSFRAAISLQPQIAEAHNNLGLVMRDLGRAGDAELCIREALRLNPGYVEANYNRGLILVDLGRFSDAEKFFREALRLNPNYVEAHNTLGLTLTGLGRSSDAEKCYREALRLKPDYFDAHSNLLLYLNLDRSLLPENALAEAKRYGAAVSARALPKFSSWKRPSDPKRLRVGFVSGDLRSHPVGYFIEGLFAHLDRSAFELVAFPTTLKSDGVTSRLKPLFRDWMPICGKDDRAAAELIHRTNVQILFDLSGHTGSNRLPVFSYKPAPVQASWLGYFATTGLPEMDYFLGDPVMSPATENDRFSEKIWNLAESWFCFTPPNAQIPVSPLPAASNGYVTFGCFGNLSKMNDFVVACWANVLRRVPRSKLHLKSTQLSDSAVVEATRRRFAAEGIAVDRLILEAPSPREAYLRAYGRIDMVLDTFPYPGGTTSMEALWMGVPVLTLKGDRFLSRLGESIACNAGQASWVAADPDDFANKAQTLSADIQHLLELRATLRERVLQTALFDAKRFAEHFGEALQGMFAANAHRTV